MTAAAIRAVAEAQGLALDEASVERLQHYVALVFKWQRLANLTGAADAATFIEEHVADCLSVLPFVDETDLADIGSGAGLPGMVIACTRPAQGIHLVEPRGKRARFLQQAAITLGLARVAVVNLRVEEWQPERPPGTLVCRALSSLENFVASTRHLHTPHTRLLAMKGEQPVEELAAPWVSGFRVEVHPLQVPGRAARCLVELRPLVGPD